MRNFKENWEIDQNWQLLYPLLGVMGLIYSSYKLADLLLENFLQVIGVTLVLSVILLRICLFVFKKLEGKWQVNARWEFIRIFIVFAITGSSSVLVSRPIISLLGITKENLNIFLYYLLFIFVSLIVYQILLVSLGWLFGQFSFFWEFEKKMLRRLGFKNL